MEVEGDSEASRDEKGKKTVKEAGEKKTEGKDKKGTDAKDFGCRRRLCFKLAPSPNKGPIIS